MDPMTDIMEMPAKLSPALTVFDGETAMLVRLAAVLAGELHRLDAAADRPEGCILGHQIDEELARLPLAAIPRLVACLDLAKDVRLHPL